MTRCLLLLLAVGACAAQPKSTLTMKRYTLVLLHRGTPDPNADAEAIQKGHMANIEAIAKLGKLILAGPIENDDLRNRIVAATGMQLPTTLLFDHPTPDALARFLAQLLRGNAGNHAPAQVRAPGPADEPIAIVAIGCRFPGGVATPEDLWHLLSDGRDVISSFPDNRG